jgi:hypothetical protein
LSDKIPSFGTHRGVPLHDYQSPERLSLVRAEIDRVVCMTDAKALFDYAADVSCPPEARMLAGAKLEAAFEAAIDERRERPAIDLQELQAHTAGLDSQTWRSPTHYCVLPDSAHANAVRRATPLPDR